MTRPPSTTQFPTANIILHTTNRHHGFSRPPFNSLNLSFGVGDQIEAVRANRSAMKQKLELPRLLSSQQVHSDRIFIQTNPLENDFEATGYDALITNVFHLGLMIQQADCQAVMLWDPVKQVIANVHCGWKGSTLNIIGKTIQAMIDSFQSKPAHLHAAISPSLGPCCAEFIHFKKMLPETLHIYQASANHFDFWAISRDQISRAGVPSKNISLAGICTKCDLDYFSYRRHNTTGRFASIIAQTPQ